MSQGRLQALRNSIDSLGIDAFLITFSPHLRYMSGFSGSSGIGIVTRRSTRILTDGRYVEQVRREVQGWKTFIVAGGLFEEIKKRKLLRPGWRVGFDGNTLTYNEVRNLKRILPSVKFLPKVDVVDHIAAVKDDGEITKIKQAVDISDKVFAEVTPLIKPGVAELDIAAEISYRQRKHGAERDAFETIVASGARSSLPHGRASAKRLARNEFITMDFGCVVGGYHSDMTRTVVLGRPTAEMKKIYTAVLDAQQRAIDAARSNLKAKELDAVARNTIKSYGYDKFFRHSLGHGLGLQIHEPPRISVLSTATLQSGNVVTIEPGVYIPRLGGVRIEDDVVIRNGHCEVLNRSPKELILL